MGIDVASRRDLRANRIVVGLMILAAALFWFTRKPPPPVAIVNGVYSNPCCRPVEIRNGSFIIGSNHVQFTLLNMKTGLEATPTQNITVNQDGVQATVTDDDHRIYIGFDNDRRGFTLLGPSMREFHFRR